MLIFVRSASLITGLPPPSSPSAVSVASSGFSLSSESANVFSSSLLYYIIIFFSCLLQRTRFIGNVFGFLHPRLCLGVCFLRGQCLRRVHLLRGCASIPSACSSVRPLFASRCSCPYVSSAILAPDARRRFCAVSFAAGASKKARHLGKSLP